GVQEAAWNRSPHRGRGHREHHAAWSAQRRVPARPTRPGGRQPKPDARAHSDISSRPNIVGDARRRSDDSVAAAELPRMNAWVLGARGFGGWSRANARQDGNGIQNGTFSARTRSLYMPKSPPNDTLQAKRIALLKRRAEQQADAPKAMAEYRAAQR